MTNREDKTAIIYKKLVRDRIPEIIRNHGQYYKTRIFYPYRKAYSGHEPESVSSTGYPL